MFYETAFLSCHLGGYRLLLKKAMHEALQITPKLGDLLRELIRVEGFPRSIMEDYKGEFLRLAQGKFWGCASLGWWIFDP